MNPPNNLAKGADVVSTWDKVREINGSAGIRTAAPDQVALLPMSAPLSNSFLLLTSDLESMGVSSLYCCESRFFLQSQRLVKELLDGAFLNGWSSETITAGPKMTGIKS